MATKDVLGFKLISGEFVFGLVEKYEDGNYVVSKPFVMVSQGNQVMFMPWLPVTGSVVIRDEALVTEPVTMDDLLPTLRAELSKVYFGIEIATTPDVENLIKKGGDVIHAPFGTKKAD